MEFKQILGIQFLIVIAITSVESSFHDVEVKSIERVGKLIKGTLSGDGVNFSQERQKNYKGRLPTQ